MSRIEKALERAAKLRDGKPAADAPPAAGIRIRKPAAGSGSVFDTGKAKLGNSCIVTLNDPRSPVSEEYRKLKSMIVKLTKQAGFQNTLMITSAFGWEGKSITAINLAITLSQDYDHTVLLVDADLRKPSLHTHFDIVPEAGLTDCLIDDCDIAGAVVDAGIGRLQILPAGKEVKDPAELLSSQRMRELVFELKHRYSDRYVIFDTPPVLLFAETHAISSMIDEVIFVVKEGMTPVRSVREALEVLKYSKVLGIVYNSADDDIFDMRRKYVRGLFQFQNKTL